MMMMMMIVAVMRDEMQILTACNLYCLLTAKPPVSPTVTATDTYSVCTQHDWYRADILHYAVCHGAHHGVQSEFTAHALSPPWTFIPRPLVVYCSCSNVFRSDGMPFPISIVFLAPIQCVAALAANNLQSPVPARCHLPY